MVEDPPRVWKVGNSIPDKTDEVCGQNETGIIKDKPNTRREMNAVTPECCIIDHIISSQSHSTDTGLTISIIMYMIGCHGESPDLKF